jgi:hypothetical protein
MHIGLWWESQQEIDHQENLKAGRKTRLKWILDVYDEAVKWIDLAQDRDQWRDHGNTIINVVKFLSS